MSEFFDEEDSFEFGIPEHLKEYFRAKKESLMPYFTLENGKVRKCTKEDFYLLFEIPEARRVDKTEISEKVSVSTVFLSIDHNFSRLFDGSGLEVDTRPILFETMIFGGRWNELMWRYYTYGEAKQGHWKVVDALRNRDESFLGNGDPFWSAGPKDE